MNLEFIEIPFLKLGTNGKIRTGAGFHSSDFKTEGVPLIKIGNIQNNEIDLKDCSFISEEEKKNNLTSENDLLIAMRGATSGKLGIVSKECKGCFYVGSIGNLGKINDDIIYRPFVKYIEQQLFEILKTESKGTATPMVSIGMLEKFKLIIPKSKEQQKYLFELLESRKQDVGELSTELTYQLDLVKQLRQAFLREAMQGKLLTPVTSSGVEKQETGHDLLAKIKAEKAQLIAEKKLKKEKELPPISEEEIPFEIPAHWAWCRLGEISKYITSGSRDWAKFYSNEGAYFIRSGEIKTNSLIIEDAIKVNLPTKIEGKRSLVEKGDLLTTITGGNVGKCAFIDNIIPEAYVSQSVALTKLIDIRIGKFVHFCFQSPIGTGEDLKSSVYGIGRPVLSLPQIQNLKVPLPPLHEQEQIVAKLEELMSFCDGLEQSIKESQGYNEKLLQQVLREALQGKKERV